MWLSQHARCRGIRFCNRSAGNHGLRDDACLQPGYLPGRCGYPESGTEKTLQRKTGICSRTSCALSLRSCGNIWQNWVFVPIDEMVGRSDLLKVKEDAKTPMAAKMDLSQILYNPYAGEKESVTFSPEKRIRFPAGKNAG